MYNEYFGFNEAPFSIAPDPRYLYMTAQHREALAHLVYGLNSDGGCILLTGEVGTGKTTICRCLLEQIPEQAKVALVLNPKVSEIELLETICDELKIPYPDADNSVKIYTDRIYQFLIEGNRNHKKTVLIIDEAQNLSSAVLEQLRLLTNLETNQRKLLQIIILGQPELLNILAKTEMRQLAQRITARFHLQPLTKNDVKAYVSHRLAVAGQNIQLFPDSSIKRLYKLSKGVPRLINILCDRALLGTYVENQHAVNPSILNKAAIEVFGELKNVERQQKNKQWLYPIVILATLTAIAIGFFLYLPLTTSNNMATGTLSDPTITKSDNIITDHNADKTKLSHTENIVAEQAPSNTTILTSEPNHNAIIKIDNDSISSSDTAEQYDELTTILSNVNSNQISAYEALFEAWNFSYNKKSTNTACNQAKIFSLRCLHKQGNLNSLKSFNRPAVLTMVNTAGEKRHITITAIWDNSATVYSNNTKYTVSLSDLDRYWYGHFNLLWKMPEGYSTAISPGNSGNIANWLNQQFTNNKLSNTNVYQRSLIENVKAFQLKHGLAADGIVGPVTIMHLNTLAELNIPTLTTQN